MIFIPLYANYNRTMGTIQDQLNEWEESNKNSKKILHLFSHLNYDQVIHLEATFKGTNILFIKNQGYIIFPRMTSMFDIKIHGHGKEIIYSSIEAFLSDWTDLQPYKNCPLATELIRKINHV